MLIRLIGQVAVFTGQEPQRITASKQACVLAVLAAEPGVPVSHAQLIDRVWDGAPPDTVTSVLYSYIARLRRLLEPAGASIHRAGAYGYALDVPRDDIDLHRLRDLAEQAAAADASGDRAAALDAWRRVCDPVRDQVLMGIGGTWAGEFRAAFDREVLGWRTRRYAAELDAGNHTGIADELAALAGAEPLSEPLIGHLMLALYRSGEPAEALRWFEATRIRLRDELGADPSAGLRGLHRRILEQDPGLAAPAAPAETAAQAPDLLPADVTGFVGRDGHLAALSALADQGTTALVVGHAGAGKTSLAVHWGRTRRERFPGGRLYIDLRGFDREEAVRPREALARLLQALGCPGDRVPDDVDAAAELLRSRTEGRRMLVILDNAGTADQVRPLLPGPGCFTIVTSRNRLAGLIALNDARPVDVGMLPRNESMRLLGRLLGETTVTADAEAADELARLCGDLPLALRIAAANLGSGFDGGITAYVKELAGRDRLALLSVDGDPKATVTAALDLSYTDLDAESRGLFRRLGALPGEDASAGLIAAVSGMPANAAARSLRRLAAGCLVEHHRRGRYRMHDLVRLYATTRAEAELTPEERREVADEFIAWHHRNHGEDATAEQTNLFMACETLRNHPEMWRLVRRMITSVNNGTFLGRVSDAIDAGMRLAEENDDALGVFYMVNMRGAWLRARGEIAEGIEVGELTLKLAANLGHAEVMLAKGNQGLRYMEASELRKAARLLAEAVDLAARVGIVQVRLANTSALAQLLTRLGRAEEAAAYLDAAEPIAAELPSARWRPQFAIRRADVLVALGRVPEATAVLDEVYDAARTLDPPFREKWCLSLGDSLERVGRLERSREVLDGLLAVTRAHPDTVHGPATLLYQAKTLVALGEHRDAIAHIAEARDGWRRMPPYAAPMMSLILALAHNGLGEHAEALGHAEAAVTAYAAMPWPGRHEWALRALAEARAGLGGG